VSAKRPLQTFDQLLRRDYKRRWRKANPDKTREYYARSVARQVDKEWQAKQGVML